MYWILSTPYVKEGKQNLKSNTRRAMSINNVYICVHIDGNKLDYIYFPCL